MKNNLKKSQFDCLPCDFRLRFDEDITGDGDRSALDDVETALRGLDDRDRNHCHCRRLKEN